MSFSTPMSSPTWNQDSPESSTNATHPKEISTTLEPFSFSELVDFVENPQTAPAIREYAWKMIDIFLWQDGQVPPLWQDWPELSIDGRVVTKEMFVRDVLDHDKEKFALTPQSPDEGWRDWPEYTAGGKTVTKEVFDHEIDFRNMRKLDWYKRGKEDTITDDEAASAQLRREYALSLISKLCQTNKN